MATKLVVENKSTYLYEISQNNPDNGNNKIYKLTASKTTPKEKPTSAKCMAISQSIFESIEKRLLKLPLFTGQLDYKTKQRILFGARNRNTKTRNYSAASAPNKIVVDGTESDKCLARKKIELIHLLQRKHNNKKTDQDAFKRELEEIDVNQLTNIPAIAHLTNKLNLKAPKPRALWNSNKTEINAKSVQIKKQTIHEINFEIAVKKCFKTCESIFDKINKNSFNNKKLYITYETRKHHDNKIRIRIKSPSINHPKQDRISISKPEHFISDNCEEIDKERIKLISNIYKKYNKTSDNTEERSRLHNFMEKFGEIYSDHSKEFEFLQKLNTTFANNQFPVIEEEPTQRSSPTINALTSPTLMPPLLMGGECMGGGGFEPQPENADVNDPVSQPSDLLDSLYTNDEASCLLAENVLAFMNGDPHSGSMPEELRFEQQF